MENKIEGILISVLPEKTGKGKSGKDWKTQDFIVETTEQYPKKICFTAWNDKLPVIQNTTLGTKISVFFNAESREFNGKWYTSLKVWKLEIGVKNSEIPKEEIQENQFAPAEINDLPF